VVCKTCSHLAIITIEVVLGLFMGSALWLVCCGDGMCDVHSDTVDYTHLSVSDDTADTLHAVGIVAGSHVSVTSLRHADGTQLPTHLIAAPWMKAQHK